MRTGVSYLGHHNPRHMKADMDELRGLGCDDVLLAAQENDFIYMPGKLDFLPEIARERGLRPLVVFWGVLNLFGGGRSSQFLLEYPQAHQVRRDGTYHSSGCYNIPEAVAHIKSMIDRISERGFEGYFIDEPSLLDCFCPSCRQLYHDMHTGDLFAADEEKMLHFRKLCVGRYICLLSDYIKTRHPQMETLCCLMPGDRAVWEQVARIDSLDNLGTDIYWANEDTPVEQMRPLVRDMAQLCKKNRKQHHEWLQAWGVRKGREARILAQGEILISEKPDALYVWAYEGQIGTSESCEDPAAAWKAACEILRRAKRA
jgi:hypothetical protein